MRKNPERLAWLVLILSFAVCGLTATVLPAGAVRLLDDHTSARGARLDIVHGTVLVRQAGAPLEQSAKDGLPLEAGDVVRTASDARAIIWLFDDSNVELGPDATVTLRESYASTFNNRFSALALSLTSGKPTVNVALPSTQERRFTVTTDVGSLALDEGSYELDLSRAGFAEAVVRAGRALITSADRSLTCKTGERAELRVGTAPAGPLSLERNLVRNGDFSLPASDDARLGANWKTDERGTENQMGTAEVATSPEGNYLRFNRTGVGHGENYAVQVLEREVSQFRTLRLRLEARLVNQTLGGGGVAGTEYPLHVRLQYQYATRREARFETAFYYQNVQNHPTSSGSLVGYLRPQGEWFTVEVDLTRLEPRPLYLFYLEVAASGWDYETHVRNVQLMAE